MPRFILPSPTTRRGQERLHRLALLVGVCTVAGLLVAGVALPVVGGLGLAARRGAEQFDSLPSELKTAPLPQATRILAADGSVIAQFYYENRISVPLSRVAPVMRQAIIAVEDARFYQHSGVDLKGVVRALVTNSTSGTIRQGGSTITQQYVKNVLIESATTAASKEAATEDTLARKVREARYAIALENHLTKDQILERYLNIAYFGSDAYGVEAASRRFFNRHASQLTLPQAALLAGLVRNPAAYDPLNHPKAGRERRDTVLARMLELRYLSQATYAKTDKAPLGLHPTASKNSCQTSIAPFFCDYVEKRFLADPALGRTQEDRLKLLLRGGLDIHTTLEPKVQRAAQASVDQHVPRSSEFGSATAMVQPGTGQVLAIAENRNFGSSTVRGKGGAHATTVDYATNRAYGGSSGFQSGSTFKVFTLAAALEAGVPLGLRIHAPNSIDYGTLGPTDCSGKPYYDLSHRHAFNSEGEGGTYNLLTGTWHSVNTFFLLLEKRVGMCPIAKLAESLGVTQASGAPLQVIPPLTLGVNNVSPLSMAAAVATFAAHGKYCPANVITSVRDTSGKNFPVSKTTCKQAVSQGVADTVTYVLQGVLTKGTAAGLGLGRPAAGKTGTVTEYADAWFMGYVPQLASAVFVGDPRGPQGNPLRDVTIGGHRYPRVFGATIPGPIWQDAMKAALVGVPVENFPPPSSSVSAGKPLPVPDVHGMPVAAAQKALSDAGFVPKVAPKPIPAGGKAGTVAKTDPPAGSKQLLGATVTIFVTNGKPPPPSPGPSGTPGPGGSPPPTETPKPKPTHHHQPHR